MANQTLKGALNVRGTNPQHLVEKVVRARIYDSPYWKEHCFALTAASIVPVAARLPYIGGSYGAQRPSPFLCLLLKLLQLQPARAIILEYIAAPEFKYLRALAAMYVRMTFPSLEVYEVLEPMLNDYRKLRWRDMSGTYRITHMDEFVDSLLTEERVADLILPRLTRRDVLEEGEGLAPRASRLEDALLARAEGSGGEESDDSVREAREDRARRTERARRIRDAKGGPRDVEEADEEDYVSQEESDQERFVSRSPTPSGSEKAGYVSRSPSKSPAPRFVSRSPSRSPQPGFVSRSPTRSPERS